MYLVISDSYAVTGLGQSSLHTDMHEELLQQCVESVNSHIGSYYAIASHCLSTLPDAYQTSNVFRGSAEVFRPGCDGFVQ